MAKIGIIGSGNIGAALARRFRAVGHDVALANSRGPQSLSALAAETGAQPVSVGEAANGRDVVVVTIPLCRVPDLPRDLFAGAGPELVVIDTCNYYPRERDGRIEPIEAGLPESRWVEQQLGHPVVKVFNGIYARHLQDHGKPAGAPGRIALPLAGDDARAKDVVMRLVDQIGFDPVDAGDIDQSWRQQPGSPHYGKDFDAAGLRRALAEASQERTPQWSGTVASPGSFDAPA